MENRTVIIGSGAAAYECVKKMVEENYQGEIHVFSNTDKAPYNPMLTTYYAVGKLNYEGMFPYGTENVWEDLGAIFHGNDPVENLDGENKVITTKSGLQMKFDNCLIATGATPVMPPIKGHESKKLLVVRTVEDAIALKEAAEKKPKRVIVVGASMVGVKVMELFYKAGSEICLVDMAPYIFSLAAHEECAKVIDERLVNMGIKLRYKAGMSGVEETENGVKMFFGEGEETEEGDIAIICVGVRANTSFIKDGSIEKQRGVLVDEHMETNVKGIYAAGDVSQGMELLFKEQIIIGLWANARLQGRNAGANIMGIETKYEGNILHNITHFMGMDFVGLGKIKGYTHMECKKTDTGIYMLFWENDKLIGANFLDQYLSSGVLRNALVAGDVHAIKNERYIDEHARLLEEILNSAK